MAPVIYYQVKKGWDEPSGSSSCLVRAFLNFCISTFMGWDLSPSQIISSQPRTSQTRVQHIDHGATLSPTLERSID